MALSDNTFPQSGDPDDAVRFAQLIGQGNLVDHVESGLTVTPDFAGGTVSVSEGVCFIGIESDTATSDGQEIQGLGYAIQLASSSVTLLTGDNHIAVVPAYGTNDENSVKTFGVESNIPNSALKIAFVDEAAETVTEVNRSPIGEFEEISVENGVSVNNGQDLLATQTWVDDSIATAVYSDTDAIAAIDGEISLAATSVSELDSVVEANASDVGANSTDISTLQSDKLDVVNYTPVTDVGAEISLSANDISGLDSAVSSNDSDISSLQSNKFDAVDYTPETDTHSRYTDSEAVSAADAVVSTSANSLSGMDTAVSNNDSDISDLQSNKFDTVDYTPVADVDSEISLAAASISGLDSTVDSNTADISSLQSTKLDAASYNPESDTHSRYTDSEATNAVTSSVDVSSLLGGGGSVDQIIATNGTDLRYTTVDALRTDPPVDSVFGRTGSVTASSGDYTHSQIDGISSNDHHAKYTDSEALSAVESNISTAALTVSGLDSAVNTNASNISSLQSNKFDAVNYNPEADTHSRYTDSEAVSAVDGEVSAAATSVSGLDTAVSNNDSDISSLQTNKLDSSNYTPEADTHSKYTDSDTISAISGATITPNVLTANNQLDLPTATEGDSAPSSTSIAYDPNTESLLIAKEV